MSALSLDERLAGYLGSIYRALADETDRIDPARDRSQRPELTARLMNIVRNAADAYVLLTGHHPTADGFRQLYQDADGRAIHARPTGTRRRVALLIKKGPTL